MSVCTRTPGWTRSTSSSKPAPCCLRPAAAVLAAARRCEDDSLDQTRVSTSEPVGLCSHRTGCCCCCWLACRPSLSLDDGRPRPRPSPPMASAPGTDPEPDGHGDMSAIAVAGADGGVLSLRRPNLGKGSNGMFGGVTRVVRNSHGTRRGSWLSSSSCETMGSWLWVEATPADGVTESPLETPFWWLGWGAETGCSRCLCDDDMVTMLDTTDKVMRSAKGRLLRTLWAERYHEQLDRTY